MDHPTIQAVIQELPLKELVVLRDSVDVLIKQRKRDRNKALYSQFTAMAQEAGFGSVDEVISSLGKSPKSPRSPRSDKGVRLPPKYANPQDAKQTWSGKGRKPGWVVSHLANGGQLETLEIA
ncbi:MAG: H-NS histone family protein [Magnetococcales bacterium]|nr:H-NS histone family protein [Magnetococcales bacterium]